MSCHTPPRGWACSRREGHEGPCAARRCSPVYPNEVLLIALLLGAVLWAFACGVYYPVPNLSVCAGASQNHTNGTFVPMGYVCSEWETER